MSKSRIVLVMFILSLCGISFALDPMGPTTSELKQGEKALGLEYAWSEMDIKVDFPSFADNLNKTLEIDNLHKIYAKFVWGISDDFDAFIRLGAAGGDNSFKINDPGSQVGRRDGGTDWDLLGPVSRQPFSKAPKNWNGVSLLSTVRRNLTAA